MADFSDLFNQYMGARIGQATGAFTDPTGYLTNTVYGDLGLDNPDQVGNTKPKTTTIKHNDDGSKEITNKYEMPAVDYSLNKTTNPYSTMSAPGEASYSTQQQPVVPVAPDQNAAETARLAQQEQFAQGVPQAPVQQPEPQGVPRSMSGVPQTGAGMFPQGAQPIPTQALAPDLTAAIQKNETGGLANPNAAVGAAGERGAMQVLPTTSRDPGFGVKPAQDNSPEELNRVGRDYYTAMQQRYNDPVLAAAAYNAGPGTMDKAIARSQAEGGHPMAYMPAATQDYAGKFAQTIGYKPGQTNAENPAVTRPWIVEGTGLHMPGHEINKELDIVNAAKGNPEELHKIAYNPATPPMLAKIAIDDLTGYYDAIKAQQKAEKVVTSAATGDTKATNELMRDLRKENEEGSYVKAYLFARLGLTDLARNEQQKLGAGSQTSIASLDGQQYAVRLDGQGNITKAYDSSGAAVPDSTIAKLQSNYAGIKGAQAHTATFKDKDTGELYVQQTMGGGQTRIVNMATGVPFQGKTSNLMAYGIGADVERKNVEQLQTLRNRLLNEPNIDAAKELAKFNALNGTNYNYSQVINAQPAMTAPVGGAPTTPGITQAPTAQAFGTQAPAQPSVAQPQAAATAPGVVPGPAGVSTAASSRLIPVPAQPAPGESPTAFAARRNQVIETNKKISGEEADKMHGAEQIYDVVKEINDTLPKATGSVIGTKIDQLAGIFGHSTEGAQATAKLQVLGDRILKSVPRFSGATSDRDVASYKAAAGQLADPNVPIETRIAAFRTIQDINKKYAPDLDWDFNKQPGQGFKIIKREKIQ